MTTVSLLEINSPVSLRTCGSSISSLVHRRTRLQCFSPDKRAAAYKARTQIKTPEVANKGGRVSVSPKVLGLEGTQLASSPAESPVPRFSITPHSGGRQSRFAGDEFSSSESLEGFSDDDDVRLGDTDGEEDDKQKLFVVGCSSKLRGQFEVPNIKALEKKLCPLGQDHDKNQHGAANECDRESDTSPENPPPSPINFRPSLDGFVVGGQKLVCPPEKSTSSPGGTCCNHRDFVPGFVKRPLYHCNKCEGKVKEEEQSEVALQRRRSFLLHSRMSSQSKRDDSLLSVGSRLGQDSHVLLGSMDSLSPGFQSPDGYYDRTFIEIYLEKKKLKEEKDRELEEQKQRKREKRRNEEKLKKKAKAAKLAEKDAMRNNCEKGKDAGERENSEELILTSLGKINKSSSNIEVSDSRPNGHKNGVKFSGAHVKNPAPHYRCSKHRSMSLDSFMIHQPEVEKLQIRRCWSDIWPFPGHVDFNRQSEDDLFSYNFGTFRSKSRITPFYPLPRRPVKKSMVPSESVTSNQSNHATTVDDFPETPTPLPVEIPDDVTQVPPQTPEDDDSTMTATIMIPPRDNSCNQWVSFSAENEPILNDAPDVDDDCDTFLKRLQRTKMSNADPSLPAGQFCFEAVVDKRYNRWKRRRRRKKEGEHRRAVRPVETDSSDDNDDRNPAVEQILDRMYDQIHGPAPLTPNGTRDTPRLRNRRRRKDEQHERYTNKDANMASSSDAAVSNYDASSEWTSSDRDCGHLSSNSGLGQCVENGNGVNVRKPSEKRSSEDLCCWPFLEQYKQEILKKIQNTPADQLEEMDQKDWLPDITSHYNGRTSKASQRSDKDDMDDLEAKTLSEFSSLRSRERSGDSASTLVSNTSTKGPERACTTPKAVTSNIYKKWTRNQQSLRNTYPPAKNNKLLSRTEASSWGEMGTTRQKSAGKIGLVAVGNNDLDNTFKASLRPIMRDDTQTGQGQPKQTKKSSKEQPKGRMGLNLPALSKNLKSQALPARHDNITKVRKKPQTPVTDKPSHTKPQQLSRPKTQPAPIKKGNRDGGGAMDPNLIFRDYYLKTLYNDRVRVNSHIGPYASGKHLKKALTVDQLDIGRRKNRTDEDKLSDLAFTRSFTFSMFDLPEVYKMYNSNLVRKANGEVIDSD